MEEMLNKQVYFVANLKSNKTFPEFRMWFDEVNEKINQADNSQMIICPPFPYLAPLSHWVKQRNLSISIGAQDVSEYPFGAYTGAVTAEMIKPFGQFVIVGHSERRKYYKETNATIAAKVARAIEVGLTPILCVDEPYALAQFAAVDQQLLSACIVAYEPLEAIGSGIPDNSTHANQVVIKLKKRLPSNVPVLYGGSVNPNNVSEFISQSGISGVLVGSASLDAELWNELIR